MANMQDQTYIMKMWEALFSNNADRFFIHTDGRLWLETKGKPAILCDVDVSQIVLEIKTAEKYAHFMVDHFVPDELKGDWRLGMKVEQEGDAIETRWAVLTPYKQNALNLDMLLKEFETIK